MIASNTTATRVDDVATAVLDEAAIAAADEDWDEVRALAADLSDRELRAAIWSEEPHADLRGLTRGDLEDLFVEAAEMRLGVDDEGRSYGPKAVRRSTRRRPT